jgi:hypothetical protein
MQLRPVEIDVDVFRFLESRRSSFTQTHNDILRELAGLSPIASSKNGTDHHAASGAWSWKGVELPNGTRLRMSYNGQTHTGEIAQGTWHVGGAIYRSPSAAAGGVARSKKGAPVSLDGWAYWEVKKPNSDRWTPISTLRK